MKESKSMTQDPICGMTVDEASALHAERDGKTFYFCSDHCRQKFLSTTAGANPEGNPHFSLPFDGASKSMDLNAS